MFEMIYEMASLCASVYYKKNSKAERRKIVLWMMYYKEREKGEVKCLLSVLGIPVAELR